MKGVGQASAEMAQRYFALFVNRLAYTLQSHNTGREREALLLSSEAGSPALAPDHSRSSERSANRWPVRAESEYAALQVGGN
jgi:hypothetical protein